MNSRRMILFLSDIHLGSHSPAGDRHKERELLDLLAYHEEELEALYLLGDIFHCFLEYRHLIPGRFIRFQAALAALCDRGIPVTFFAGNHDPWHLSYFTRELGLQLVPESRIDTLGPYRVYLAHGDRLLREEGLRYHIKGWIRKPWLYTLYRSLLPADVAYRLAYWVSLRFGKEELDAQRTVQLTRHARRLLRELPVDMVVLGHSHVAGFQQWPEGAYLNPGYWGEARTYACLKDSEVQLLRWTSSHPEIWQRHVLPEPRMREKETCDE